MVAPVSVFSSFTGTGKETTYGTPVTAASFTPSTAIQTEDVKNYVPDTGMRGSAVTDYLEIPTQGWTTFSYDCPVYMDTIGVPLKGILGAETQTGAGPFVHAIALNNTAPMQPPSYTIVDYNGFEARKFPGGVFSQVTFTATPSGLLTASVQGMALASSNVTTPTKSFSTKTALAGYVGVVTVAGSGTLLAESATMTIARTVNPIIAINASTSPISQFAADVKVTGSLTFVFEDDTFYTPFLSGTIQTLDFSFTNGADILQLHGTSTLFTKAVINRGSNGWMELAVDYECVGNTTDADATSLGYSPIKATLTNTISSAY